MKGIWRHSGDIRNYDLRPVRRGRFMIYGLPAVAGLRFTNDKHPYSLPAKGGQTPYRLLLTAYCPLPTFYFELETFYFLLFTFYLPDAPDL